MPMFLDFAGNGFSEEKINNKMAGGRRITKDERLADAEKRYEDVMAANNNNQKLAIKAVVDEGEKRTEEVRKSMVGIGKAALIVAAVGIGSFFTGWYAHSTPNITNITNTPNTEYKLSEVEIQAMQELRDGVTLRDKTIKEKDI